MYILKNALVSISRTKGRNILIGIIVIVIAFATTVTLAIHNSAKTIVEAYENKYNIEATISVNRESVMIDMKKGTESMEENIEKWNNIKSPTIEEITEYENSEYVNNFYYTNQIGMNGSDLTPASDTIQKTETDTTITKFEGNNDRPGFPGGGKSTTTTTHSEIISTIGNNGDFTLIGYSTLEAMSEFVNGNYTISEGEIDTNFDDNSCVISKELATLNEINIGDAITLINPSNTKLTYELIVTGIYDDNEENSNTMDKMYSNSANKIITNTTFIDNIINDDEDIKTTITPTYILKNKDVAEEFANEVQEKGLSEYYTVSNNIETIEAETKSISNVSSFALTFLIITLTIGSVVLLVINMINVRERKYEIGVLRTIGMKKCSVISQFVIELLIVSLVGLIIGAGVGSLCSVNIANKLLESEITNATEEQNNIMENFGHGNKEMNNNNMPSINNGIAKINQITNIEAVVNFKVLLELLGVGLGLTLISSLSAMISIANFRPLTILKERS